MFSDLVGSTALSARMDPEDLREVISAYQKCVAETVRASVGSSPSTWATACSSISAIRRRTRTMQSGPCGGAGVDRCGKRAEDLRTPANPGRHRYRIGRGRRPDRLGSFAGARHRRRDAEPRGALQGIADPNTVVIAESTRKLVGSLFELEDLGAKDLKGIAGPVRAFAALRPARWKAASRPCTLAA